MILGAMVGMAAESPGSNARGAPVCSRATAVCNHALRLPPRRPWRSTGAGRPWSGRNLSALSHGLTGRYRTMASLPDIWQDV